MHDSLVWGSNLRLSTLSSIHFYAYPLKRTFLSLFFYTSLNILSFSEKKHSFTGYQ